MSRTRRVLTLTALAVLLASATAWARSAPATAAPAATTNPFAAHALADDRRYAFDGEIVETLEAGSYLYLRVATERGDRWVATLRATRPARADVTVRVLGEATDFRSPRLGRDFERLAFGVVRAR